MTALFENRLPNNTRPEPGVATDTHAYYANSVKAAYIDVPYNTGREGYRYDIILVVDYKGEDRVTAADAQEKNLIGELWAERSGGQGLFIMIDSQEFHRIAALVRQAG